MEKAKMKKTFLYAFAAVMLGVGIMLFPLWTFFMRYGEEGPIGVRDSSIYFKPMSASENLPDYMMTKTEGVPAFSDPRAQTGSRSADASLQIITVGFIAAVVAFVIVRRRVHRETYLPMYRIPQW
jgi:hypothetical protein